MRDFLKSSGRRLSAGWFWPLVLLALPNCGLDSGPLPPTAQFIPGSAPRTSAIMCDIQRVGVAGKHCASDDEVINGIPTTAAALSLWSGVSSSGGIALDYSPSALAQCESQGFSGKPMAMVFFGPYPEGYAACLNCGTQIPSVYPDGNAVCVAVCEDLINLSEGPFPGNYSSIRDIGATTQFCQQSAHVSTNFDPTSCFADACGTDGALRADFADPRRIPEPVKWVDQVGTSSEADGSLTRTAPTTGPETTDFNAGAASEQAIAHANAEVEFQASDNNRSHVLGLSSVPCYPCSDQDPSLADINVAISLNSDGHVYLIENGNLVTGPEIDGSFGTYSLDERFALEVKDNFDGTATISSWRVSGLCTANQPCNHVLLAFHAGPGLVYPLRVEGSFREKSATLKNVTIVRVK